MGERGGRVSRIAGRPPAAVRVRAALLAAVARPGGLEVHGLEAAVAAQLGSGGPDLRRRVEGALGLLIATGHVDEIGGRLVLTLGAREAV